LDKFRIWMRFSLENSVRGKHVIFDLNHKKFLNIKNIPARLRDFIWDNRITYHKLAPQKTVYVPTGPLSVILQWLTGRKHGLLLMVRLRLKLENHLDLLGHST